MGNRAAAAARGTGPVRGRRSEDLPITLADDAEVLVCPICHRHVVFVERDPSPDSLYCASCGVHLLRPSRRWGAPSGTRS
jgi:hypothetical protein